MLGGQPVGDMGGLDALLVGPGKVVLGPLGQVAVSPLASVGTRSTGITGIQGPTRWRADGPSP